MKEHPILFSASMVKAILAGMKTQTRRVIKQGSNGNSYDYFAHHSKCPYGKPGDRLWVRETFLITTDNTVLYRADDNLERHEGVWKPSIFMPRWASRITLEITGVKVERVQDISEEDVIAEGTPEAYEKWNPFPMSGEPDHEYLVKGKAAYAVLWDEINGKKYPWASNPFVWVVSFKITGEKK